VSCLKLIAVEDAVTKFIASQYMVGRIRAMPCYHVMQAVNGLTTFNWRGGATFLRYFKMWMYGTMQEMISSNKKKQ
jgi:hypothetical protein